MSARRRADIARAAGELIGLRGYEATTVAQIAASAGVSSATVFYYFPDKASVFRAVFETDLPAVERLIAEHRGATDPVDGILGIITSMAAESTLPGAHGIMVELLRRIDQDPALASTVAATDAVVREGLSDLIRRGIAHGTIEPDLDPAATAGWMQAIVDAAFLHAIPEPLLSAQVRRTVSAYLRPSSTEQER